MLACVRSMNPILWLVFLSQISRCFATSCLSWEVHQNELQVIYKTDNFSTPVYFYDNKGEQRGFCDFNTMCRNIKYDREKHKVTLHLRDVYHSAVYGDWSCQQGHGYYSTNIRSTTDITSNTHLKMKGSISRSNNKTFVKVECSTCREPYLNQVQYILNNQYGNTVSFDPKSRICSNKNGICDGFNCSCSATGNQFSHAYEKDGHNEMIFSCAMIFRRGSQAFTKVSILVYDGKKGFTEIKDETKTDIAYPTTTIKTTESTSISNIAIIVIIGVGIVIVVGIFSVALCCYLKKRRKNQEDKHDLEEGVELLPKKEGSGDGNVVIEVNKRSVILKFCLHEVVSQPLRIYIKSCIEGLYDILKPQWNVKSFRRLVSKYSNEFPSTTVNTKNAAINGNGKKTKKIIEYQIINSGVHLSKFFLPTELKSYEKFEECSIQSLLKLVTTIKIVPEDMREQAIKLFDFVTAKNNEIDEEQYRTSMETMTKFILNLNDKDVYFTCALDICDRYGISALDSNHDSTEERQCITNNDEQDFKDFGKYVTRDVIKSLRRQIEDWVHRADRYSKKRMMIKDIEEQIKNLQDMVNEIKGHEYTIERNQKAVDLLVNNYTEQERTAVQNDYSGFKQKVQDLVRTIHDRYILEMETHLTKVKSFESQTKDIKQWCNDTENMCASTEPHTECSAQILDNQLKSMECLEKDSGKYDIVMKELESIAESICQALVDEEKVILQDETKYLKKRYIKVCSYVKEKIAITNKALSLRIKFEDYLIKVTHAMNFQTKCQPDRETEKASNTMTVSHDMDEEILSCKESLTNELAGYPQASHIKSILELTTQYETAMEQLRKERDQNANENRKSEMHDKLATGIAELVKSDNKMRTRFVIGFCIHEVVTPVLRKYVSDVIEQIYNKLKDEEKIDEQTKNNYKKRYGKADLHYDNINGNQEKRKVETNDSEEDTYDYKVKNHIDFSKLFLNKNLGNYKGLDDDNSDLNSLHNMIVNIEGFSLEIQHLTFQLLFYNIDTWDDCKFSAWSDDKYKEAVCQMKAILQFCLNLPDEMKYEIIEKLTYWTTEGGDGNATEIEMACAKKQHLSEDDISGLGCSIQTIIVPLLRKLLQDESTKHYKQLSLALKSQSYEAHLITFEDRVYLNYKFINSQATKQIPERHYDYNVRNEVDFSKLFLRSLSVNYSTFEELDNLHVILRIIQYILPPSSKVWKTCKQFEDEVWNPWKYRLKTKWDTEKLKRSFECLGHLVISLEMPLSKEIEVLEKITTTLNKFDKKDDEPHNNIPFHIRSIHELHLKSWANDDQFFVETRAAQLVRDDLNRNNVVIVTGGAGTGKSCLIRHVALTLHSEQDYDVIPIDPNEPFNIEKYWSIDRKQVFVVDDFCGISTLEKRVADAWRRELNKLLKLFNKEKYSAKLLMSCRRQVYKDDQLRALDSLIQTECNLDSLNLRLSYIEKKQMMEKYELSIQSAQGMLHINNFPFFCQLLRWTPDYGTKIMEDSWKKDLKMLVDNNKFQLCAVILCLLFPDGFNTKWLDNNKDENETIHCVLFECKIELVLEKDELKQIFSNLEGSYYKRNLLKNTVFTLINDQIRSAAFSVIGEMRPKLIIKYIHSRLIAEKVRFHSVFSDFETGCIFIPKKDKGLEKSYFERILKDMAEGKFVSAFSNLQLKQESYRRKWLSFMWTNKVKVRETCANLEQSLSPKTYVLIEATRTGFVDIVQFFIKLDCNIDGDDNTGSPLHVACKEGFPEIARELINNNTKKADVNSKDKFRRTPLHIACEHKNIELIKLLLKSNARLDFKDRDGNSLLHIACRSRSFEIANLLIERGANATILNNYNESPLFCACKNDHEELCKLLLSTRNGTELVNLGFSSLYISCSKGLVHIVKILLNTNADINWTDQYGNSSLHEACKRGFTDIVKLLCNNAAKIDVNDDKHTPMHIACSSKRAHADIIQVLLDEKADIGKCDKFGQSVLHLACKSGSYEKVKLLVDSKADISLSDLKGNTALHFACRVGNIDIVRLLLENEANPTSFNTKKITPLHAACKGGHVDIVQLLIEKNAIETACEEFDSPLLIACKNQNLEIISLLLDTYPDVNKLDRDGYSPLHYAILLGNITILEKLLESADCDVNIPTRKGETPLHLAVKRRHKETVSLLKKRGANESLTDKYGESPHNIAKKRGYREIESLIAPTYT